MKKRILWFILCLALVLTFFPASVLAAQTVPAGYTAISTPEDLDLIRNNLAGKYILTADIDLTKALASGGSLYDTCGWIAIGYNSGGNAAFTGVIDGNGHTIKGFKVSGKTASTSFVYQNKGTIKNLTIQGNASINIANGVFVNSNYGTIQNCHNKVSVSYSIGCTYTVYAGGIAAKNTSSGIIEYCSNQATLSGSIYKSGYGLSDVELDLGGIVGENAGTVRFCYNSGDITSTAQSIASAFAGGIVGFTRTGTKIENTYNTGKITGNNNHVSSSSYNVGAGGILGHARNDATIYISTSYNTGAIKITSASSHSRYGGALCGYAGTAIFTKCYYLNTTSKPISIGSGSGAYSLTANQMRTQAAYDGFDFNNIWTMGTYPILRTKCTHTVNYVAPKAATCTANGNIAYYYCTVCNKYFTNSSKTNEISKSSTVIAGGHRYNSVVTKPSCTSDGYTTHTCSACGDSYTDSTITAPGHTYDAVVTKPSCTSDGYTTHTCSACGDSYTDSTITAPGHTYDAVVTNPSCTSDGYTTHTCSACGDSYTDSTITAPGHTYDAVVTKPSCTSDGYTTHTCSACGDSFTDSIITASGHQDEDADGTCENCQKKIHNVITIHPHTGGKVSLDQLTAETDTEVVITVIPDEGKEVDTVTVKDENGNTISVANNMSGTYTYKQPEGNVIIEVTFRDQPAAEEPTVDTSESPTQPTAEPDPSSKKEVHSGNGTILLIVALVTLVLILLLVLLLLRKQKRK